MIENKWGNVYFWVTFLFLKNLLRQKRSSKQDNSLNMWTALKFHSAVIMFEWKDIYTSM